ncbi:MAG TPA: type II toxin-antitoxin system ParD family antitoxin [Haliea salexigens]|uniref:Antitoxin ParD n=1 Tax=Haliea salexigens TaxID=287487 RepID=A0A3C1KNG2_9GAMM|nr:type II toxin-antitoxin system ParD family antitoxin [Haliea sp.]HAN28003.1 type II toxin-antitoxin system ParD family antitoxin [Haliea salexigens]|tara:strand:+ start:343 stop:609 length:267 start_codon:yes stop_codon:yes gene_type:complete
MSRLTISMPDQMNDWVEAQISAGRYGNVSEYFRDLVRRDQELRESAIGELRTILDRAEQNGISDRSLSDVLDAARQEARQKGLLLDAN